MLYTRMSSTSLNGIINTDISIRSPLYCWIRNNPLLHIIYSLPLFTTVKRVNSSAVNIKEAITLICSTSIISKLALFPEPVLGPSERI